jgi:hypothetical protein
MDTIFHLPTIFFELELQAVQAKSSPQIPIKASGRVERRIDQPQ